MMIKFLISIYQYRISHLVGNGENSEPKNAFVTNLYPCRVGGAGGPLAIVLLRPFQDMSARPEMEEW